MDYEKEAISLLPKSLKIKAVTGMEELRIRIGRQISCIFNNKESYISEKTVSESDISSIINVATNASFYSSVSAISEGYITYNGLRIGVCGNAVLKNGGPAGFSRITSLCIRIPHDCSGMLSKAEDELYKHGVDNTLIISPPGGGKTTALRELIRITSNLGYCVAVADERDEISAGFDLGDTIDVITNMPKLPAAISMLRSMNPDVIAFDEITKLEDINVIRDIVGCGVKVIATAHGENMQSMKARHIYREMLEEKLFNSLITVEHIGQARKYVLSKL